MKKNIWIVNHYAGNMFFSEGGRHYWFAKKLKEFGYHPVVFCCNVKHGKAENYYDENNLWSEHFTKENIPFVFIRSSFYMNNGIKRIKNMFTFAYNFSKTAGQYIKTHEKPDIILASSVHPFTVLAGEGVAHKLKIPCICEIRDLWPESIFAYYPNKKNKLLAKLLYGGEKYMYKRADAVVMTWPGGADYIVSKGWSGEIPPQKVFFISNGIDLDEFYHNQKEYEYHDIDLEDKGHFKVVYTGSIRKVNNLGILIETAEILQERRSTIQLLIWGDGNELDELIRTVRKRNLHNIIFKGKVDKRNIPSILGQSDCTIMHNTSTALDKYGQSQNKFFEYLAAGKPVVMTYSVGYSICEKEHCGIEVAKQMPENIADALEYVENLSSKEYEYMSKNALETAKKYDFQVLTKALINIIEKCN